MVKRKTAIAYIRVSTTGQAEIGAGLDLQRTSIDAFAREAGFDIVDTFRDAHSAVGEDSAGERPGLMNAIEKSQQTGWPILVDGLDRFSRHTGTLEKVIDGGVVKVISTRLGENPDRATMISSAKRAQAEAERISETTKAGLQRTKARGTRLGNTTNLAEAQRLGIATNMDKAERFTRKLMPTIRRITTDRKLTRDQIAAELNQLGERAPRGQEWTAAAVRSQQKRIVMLEKMDSDLANPMFGMF